MLTKFEVTNFKNFREKLVFDLTNTNMYEFNQDCVVNGIVNKGMIYGHNGTGKSNLGLAIFDIVSHLTDRESASELYRHYTNAFNSKKTNNIAEFSYSLIINNIDIEYSYGKESLGDLVYENLEINGNKYASVDRRESTIAKISVAGAENLKTDIGDSKISILSYIKNNSILDKNIENEVFNLFLNFINRMLFFRSLKDNNYIGLEQGGGLLDDDIIKHDNVADFQKFLNDAGIECSLTTIKTGDKHTIAFDFNGESIPFLDIASHGTITMELFYFWYQRFKVDSKVSFLFIDEFDAFYHHSLSVLIVEVLKEITCQVFLTTHSTAVMSNDLMRPDCYFLLKEDKLVSLSKRTRKELREAHNIEKMYKAGAFCD